MYKVLKKAIIGIIELIFLPFFIILYFLILVYKLFSAKRLKPNLIWGTTPIISYKYYNNSMRSKGYHSDTLMSECFYINNKGDFDMYYEDFIPLIRRGFIFQLLKRTIIPYLCFCYTIWRYDIFHHSFQGGFLGNTLINFLEASLLHLAGCKVIILSHGGDVYQYSKVLNQSWLHTLISHYPEESRYEDVITRKVAYWTKNADIIIAGFQLDGLGRWDVLPFHPFIFDVNKVEAKTTYSIADGTRAVVKVIHAPNHRLIKGTEYIIHAIEELRNEGLLIELILLEKKKNDEIIYIMREEADILVDQVIVGYGMFATEGMASGLPVLSNLENEVYTRVFRRYSYLNESPILSATPESIKDRLRLLITNPILRKQLGEAGRQYVEKYHSYNTSTYMFGKVYEKIWHKKEVDLMNLFHPLLAEYNNSMPKVSHPLFENHYNEI